MKMLMVRKQSGFILITGLIFILIITIVTVSSMQHSNLDYKISSNEAFKDVAFQGSESGRTATGDGVGYFIYHRDWTGFSVSGLSHATDYDPSIDRLQAGENLYDTSTLGVDMNYDVSGSSIETIDAEISIIKAPGVRSAGSGLQQLSGYEGLGKSAGSGGIHIIYEIRSKGSGASDAVAVTASEFRVIP